MDECWLRVFEFCRDIPCQSEVRVLIYSTRDEAMYIRGFAKYLGERIGEGWRSLNRGEMNFSDIIALASAATLSHVRALADRGRTHESLNPKVAFAWFMVICREILETLR